MIVLDIGCGSTGFVRDFRFRNRLFGSTFLCGSPGWKIPFTDINRLLPPQSLVEKILSWHLPGIYHIRARYENFGLPENCLDVVILNCAHPLMLPDKEKLQAELRRCLKAGGYFIETNPAGYLTALDEEHFEKVASGRFRSAWYGASPVRFSEKLGRLRERLPDLLIASATMRDNAREAFLRRRDPSREMRMRVGLVYSGIRLTLDWVVWQKR